MKDRLEDEEKCYLEDWYKPKRHQFVRAFTRVFANLGCESSQRGESMHPAVKAFLNRHSPIAWTVEAIQDTVDELGRVFDDLIASQKKSLPRLIGGSNRKFFVDVMQIVTHQCLLFLLPELNAAKDLWVKVRDGELSEAMEWGFSCVVRCSLPLQYSLLCRCWLYRCVKEQKPIPLSLIHPRWLFDGPELNREWQMSFDPSITKAHYSRLGASSESSDNSDDGDEPRPSAFVAPAASSTDRYEEAGKVLFEKTFMELAAEAQQIPEAYKQEQFHKMLAAHMKSFKDQWDQKESNRLPQQFGEGPSNPSLRFKRGSKRGMTGREAADDAVRVERRRVLAAELDQQRSQRHEGVLQQEHEQRATVANSKLSQQMFEDGEVDKTDTDDEGVGFRDIDDIESDSEGSAGGQNSDAAGPLAIRPKSLADDSESDSDLEILGDKTGHGTSDGLMDPDVESQAWTSGAKKPFRPPPPSQSKSQSKSQFFEVDEVPDPTPLTSLS